jgi:hypothetical protein
MLKSIIAGTPISGADSGRNTASDALLAALFTLKLPQAL